MITKKTIFSALFVDRHFLKNHSICRLQNMYSSDPFGGNRVSDLLLRP